MRSRTALFALLLVIGLPAAAQSATFGLAAGFAIPGGDMTKSVGNDMTLGLGVQVRVKFGLGHAIVPRIDKAKFKGTTPDANGYDMRAESDLTSIGVDYNWFTSRKAGEGFYLSTGLGFLQKEDKVEGGSNYYYVSGSQEKDRVYFSFGLGGVIAKHVDVSTRVQFFGDEHQADTYNSNSGQYQAHYSMSTVFTLGVAYHF